MKKATVVIFIGLILIASFFLLNEFSKKNIQSKEYLYSTLQQAIKTKNPKLLIEFIGNETVYHSAGDDYYLNKEMMIDFLEKGYAELEIKTYFGGGFDGKIDNKIFDIETNTVDEYVIRFKSKTDKSNIWGAVFSFKKTPTGWILTTIIDAYL